MPARHVPEPRRPSVLRAPRCVFLLPLVVTSSFLVAATAFSYTLDQTGRWTPAVALGGTEVHMALLPSDGNPWHSKVMWWYGLGEHELFYGGLLKWKPGEYNCDSFPGTNLIKDTTIALPQERRPASWIMGTMKI